MPKKNPNLTIEQLREANRLRVKRFRAKRKQEGKLENPEPEIKKTLLEKWGITATTSTENTQWTASSP